MNICITGDANFFGEVLEQSPTKEIIDVDKFHAADFRIINLEQAISNTDFTADKYTIYSSEACIPYLKSLNIGLVSLANNHIHDKGNQGILDTMHILENAHITHCGAGKNLMLAQQPAEVDNICLLSFCDYGKHYLRNVQCASEQTPGVNPYSLDNVLQALDTLPQNKKAIIYIHWCVEYCWMVPYNYITDAKRILAHPNTITVLGTHPHIPLGWIQSHGKYALFSLGNFLFPNFSIKPPHQIFSASYEDRNKFPVMRILCPVKKRTYKKWYFINRVSMLVQYDTTAQKISWDYTVQEDNIPKVTLLTGRQRQIIHFWLSFISRLYLFPKILYIPLYYFNLYGLYAVRRIKRGITQYFP